MTAAPVLGSPHRLLNRLEPARPRRVADHPAAEWFAVGTVCVGAFVGQLTASIVSAALPALARDLHAGRGTVTWIALAYLLPLVGLLAPFGALADVVGRKSLYVAGFVVFTVASAGCAVAPSVGVLCALRVAQAVGAALLQANSVALIAGTVGREQLGRALGLQATAQAAGLAVGPAIGGLLLALGSWRLLFWAAVPFGALGVVAGLLLLPRSRDLAARATWLRGNPLLRDAAIVRGLAVGLAGFVALFGILVAVPFWLTATHRASAAHASVLLSALPVGVGLAASVSGLVARTATCRTSVAGLLLTGFGAAAIAGRPGPVPLVVALVVVGAGVGLFNPANTLAVMRRVPPALAGSASGLLNTTRGLGTALGTALAAAAVAAGSPAAALVLVIAALCLATVGGALVLAVAGTTPPRPVFRRAGRMGA